MATMLNWTSVPQPTATCQPWRRTCPYPLPRIPPWFFVSTDDITASMPLVRSQVLDGSVKSSFASLAALDGNYSSDQHRAMIFDLAMSGGTQGAHAFGAAGAGLGPGGGSSRKNGFRGPVEDGGRGTASPAQRRTRRRNKQRNHADSLSR